MHLIITTAPWSEHIHPHCTRIRKLSQSRSAAHRDLHSRLRELGFHPPFYSKVLLMPSINRVVHKNFSPPLWAKSTFPEVVSFWTDWYLFHHWHKALGTKHSCVTLGVQNALLVQPDWHWKVTPGWVALQKATCLNSFSSLWQEEEQCRGTSQSCSEEQAVLGKCISKGILN